VTVSAVVGTRSVVGFTFDGTDSGSEWMWRRGARWAKDWGCDAAHAMRA
jgi:hypothetical protein